MKTLKFKLFATMITLAAVLINTNPANAQRRATENNRSARETSSRSETKKAVEKKSTYKSSEKADRKIQNSQATAKRSSSAQPQSATRQTQRSPQPRYSESRQTERSPQPRYTESKSTNRQSAPEVNRSPNKPNSNSDYRGKNNPNDNMRSPSGVNSARTATSNRDFYRNDRNDSRYTPNRDFRGRNDYWSAGTRPGNMNYNYNDKRFYQNYRYQNQKHWDRSWERYRWNYNSWYDYYHGYNPRSFVYYRYYYHHPYYGDVIRRFDFNPIVFVHNHHKYYCYDGHFFRYHSGVGYVLVNLPFGFSFDFMPANYERVYINGYLYFRVGNLFFESSFNGFNLVQYPDRYYAIDDSYDRPGYMFDDMYY